MILDLIFPKLCLECNVMGKYICDDCFKKVNLFGYKNNNYAIFKYEGVIRKAVLALKYKFASDLVEEIVSCMSSVLKQKKIFLGSFYLVPVPLHKHRENWRGFNQANLIGEKLALEMKWKFTPNLLIRTKDTLPQVGLEGLIRHKNVSGVFEVHKNISIKLKQEKVIIFDDVYTTGSTVNEAKNILSSAGFKNIFSLTVAR